MEVVLRPITEFKDHQDAVREIGIHLDGKVFFARSDSMLIIYDFHEYRKIRGFYDSSGFDAAMFDGEEKYLIYMSDGKLHYLDLSIWKDRMVIPGELNEYRDQDAHTGIGLKVDGKENGSIEGRKIYADDSDPPEFVLQGHTNYVEYARFHPTGKILASGSADKTLKFWDIMERKEISTHKIHDDFVTAIAFNKEGTLMITGDYSGKMKVWEINISG
jgi:WD40 repeat protein